MTNEEAIEVLKSIAYMDCNFAEYLRNRPALHIAIKSLEKQIVYCESCIYGNDYKCHHKKGLRFYEDNNFCSYGDKLEEWEK